MPRDSRYTILFCGLVSLVLGAIAIGVFIYCSWRDHEFATEGKVAIGVVTGGNASEDNSSITYSFKDSAEHAHTGSVNVDRDAWNTISVGAQCSITYLADDPDVSRITDGYNDSVFVTSLLLAGFVTIPSGFILIWMGILNLKRFEELTSTGAKTEGTVALEQLENLDTDSSVKKLFALVYSYQNLQNVSQFTYALKLDEYEAEYWLEEERLHKGIAIFYDPAEPKFHVAQVAPGKFEQGSLSLLYNTKLLQTSNVDLSKKARAKG